MLREPVARPVRKLRKMRDHEVAGSDLAPVNLDIPVIYRFLVEALQIVDRVVQLDQVVVLLLFESEVLSGQVEDLRETADVYPYQLNLSIYQNLENPVFLSLLL